MWGSYGIVLGPKQNWPLERAEGPAGASPSQENMGIVQNVDQTRNEGRERKHNQRISKISKALELPEVLLKSN